MMSFPHSTSGVAAASAARNPHCWRCRAVKLQFASNKDRVNTLTTVLTPALMVRFAVARQGQTLNSSTPPMRGPTARHRAPAE